MEVTPQIRFPKANSLRFVRLEDYTTKAESDNTRLYYDFTYTSISNDCYFTKILQANNLLVQFRTNYSTFKAYIVTSLGIETEITSSVVQGAALTDERYQYELYLDLAPYLGYYCIKFYFNQDYDKPIATYQSEWFEVATSFPNCLEIGWKNSTNKPYNDGIIWGSTPQKIYIESRISDLMPGAEKSVFITENYKQITTQSQPVKTKMLQIEPIPDYLLELLNIALQHDYFYVNGVRYNNDGAIEGERLGDTRLYESSIELRVVEDETGLAYEDYTSDPEITGTLPPITTSYLLINATDFLLINDTDKLIILG